MIGWLFRSPDRPIARSLVLLAWLLLIPACAPRSIRLPTGAGAPHPAYARTFDRATADCRSVRTFTAEIALRGRVARQRVRARLLAGFERPDALRLEAVAPFGQPVFIFVARAGRATLLLPRDDRVIENAPPPAILEALAGITLQPGELRALLTGCVSSDGRATGGRQYESGWTAIDLDEGWTMFVRGGRTAAAARDGLVVEYRRWAGVFPSEVRIRLDAAAVDLSLTVSQIGANADLGAEAFTVRVPPDAQPLTIEELRLAGPLGAR